MFPPIQRTDMFELLPSKDGWIHQEKPIALGWERSVWKGWMPSLRGRTLKPGNPKLVAK